MNTPSALIVKYSCVCGLEKVECPVRLRTDNETVLQWMDDVSITLSEDHAHRSPNCHPATLKEVMIPINSEQNTRVGAPLK